MRRSNTRTNIIARHLFPEAFAPYDAWSVKIADMRQEARVAAQDLIERNPERARKLLRRRLPDCARSA